MNYSVIAVCALVFLMQLADGAGEAGSLVEQYGMIPALVEDPSRPVTVQEQIPDYENQRILIIERQVTSTINPWFTLLTCIFLHGGWMHFLGNMWFLYIFGDNVEDRIGHIGYLIFYLFCGVMASVAHLLTSAGSSIPTIGASGAIAGVMGAYFLLYPRAMVTSIVPIFFFIQIVVLPAPLFLGIWFLFQFLQGATITSVETTGVAWWAHIGGFVVGAALAAMLRGVGETSPPVEARRPGTERVGTYRYSTYRHPN
ncbi:MAG: rhomboid family intramembrane serine protease [Pirellulaceae bacterium]